MPYIYIYILLIIIIYYLFFNKKIEKLTISGDCESFEPDKECNIIFEDHSVGYFPLQIGGDILGKNYYCRDWLNKPSVRCPKSNSSKKIACIYRTFNDECTELY